MSTTTLVKLSIAAALGLAALALAPAPARAAYTNTTETWCKARTAEDQTIISSAKAVLVWRADGDLVLEPIDARGVKIWSSNTIGPDPASLCWEEDGVLRMRSGTNAVLWSDGNPSNPSTSTLYGYRPWNEYQLKNRLLLEDCSLSGHSLTFEYKEQDSIWSWKPILGGYYWYRHQTCPVFSPANAYNGGGWCFDTSQERLIARTGFADLIWRTHGGLNLVATGSRTNQIWGSGTYGVGKKLCFADDGRLQIFGANDQLLWGSSAAPGSTTTDHVLGIDRCSLSVTPLDGATASFGAPNRCPHEILPSNGQVTAGATDQIVVENDRAKLVFTPDGNLVLRTLAGEQLWTSARTAWTGPSTRAVMQTDGNLVIWGTNSAGVSSPRWASDTSGTNTLELNGCELTVRAGSTVKWIRGTASCSTAGPIDVNPGWEIKASGNSTLLRTAEAELVWQGDGNFVLYNASGSPVWASNTVGPQRRLYFQNDGNLVIYGPTGPVWATGSNGGDRKLELADNCKLRITSAGNTITTLNDSCTVAKYSFEKVDGNSLFGTVLRNDLTATTNDNVPSTQTDTNVEITLFNDSFHVFEAHAYQSKNQSGQNLDTASIVIGGNSAFSLNYTYERTVFERSMNFNVGPVPCKVTAGATGQLGVSVSFDGGSLSVTPATGLYATVSVGPGGSWGPLSASAGLRGSLVLLELSLPVTMKVYFNSATGKYNYSVGGELVLDSLSGSLGVYAEASIAGFGVDWSYTFFKWTGVSWTKSLFSKTGTF